MARVLKPGGSLVTFAGNYALPEVFNYISTIPDLKYWCTICVKHTGSHARMLQRKIFVEWKPMLWFVKGGKINDKTTAFMSDFIQSKIPDKSTNKWAQSKFEAEYVVRYLTLLEDQTC